MNESLLKEIEEQNLEIIEMNFKGNLKGLYCDNTIAIDSRLDTESEKNCILAEELGHHYTSLGNILSTNNIENAKQEKRAKNWGYEKLVTLSSLISAFEKGIRSKNDLSDYLNVTEEFLEYALAHYREKYGIFCEVDNYIVYFEPTLIILKRI
ncbi:ImmA/IrrE family metallo-endopeptidase [Clostridium hydrogenum]|uniref:ImmA/IrrE family metallo-endopeptidase n=1 Tax=Clostridium hydrogenum TaxID=2855764 RepID=UPI001F2CB877|nr:ImmA/IrrE family metallo-endopeptidase [Clostridium hydrogenum]